MTKKVTVPSLLRRGDEAPRLVAVTAYDACFGGLADAAGIDVVLVGDSVGMTILGHETTLPVTMATMLHHTAAVTRAVKRALVVGDMPFMSYQVSVAEAVRNAGRLVQEAGADAVKLEGGREYASTVAKIVGAGIPVMGHIGLLPQHVKAAGYRKRGKTASEGDSLLADAQALQEAGAFAVVIEGTDAATAASITEALSIPTIGIGAGSGCDGEVQVIHDLLGLLENLRPTHAHAYLELATAIREALATYAADVRGGRFPAWEK